MGDTSDLLTQTARDSAVRVTTMRERKRERVKTSPPPLSALSVSPYERMHKHILLYTEISRDTHRERERERGDLLATS